MSSEIIKDLVRTARIQGEKNSDSYARYMKKMENFIRTILDKSIAIRERYTTLHLFGLADNKIDRKPMVEYYMEMLHKEMIHNEDCEEFEMYEAQLASLKDCDFYISQIAMLISPENLDIGAADKDIQEKSEKIDLSNLKLSL